MSDDRAMWGAGEDTAADTEAALRRKINNYERLLRAASRQLRNNKTGRLLADEIDQALPDD